MPHQWCGAGRTTGYTVSVMVAKFEPRGSGKKVCLAASAGGHLSQLLLLEPVWKGHETICVSTGEMVRSKLEATGRTYIVGECNHQHPVRAVVVAARCLAIVLRERPDLVLSTGAAPGFLVCMWGKLLGAEVVWVDSIANARKLSLSGRMVRPFADLILSQWSAVASRYRDVEYAGELV